MQVIKENWNRQVVDVFGMYDINGNEYKLNHFQLVDSVLSFEIDLPFQIACRDNLSIIEAGEYYINLVYKRCGVCKLDADSKIQDQSFFTRVIINIFYLSKDFEKDDTQKIFNIFFDAALACLNRYLASYMLVTKDTQCYKISKEMLSPFIKMNFYSLIKDEKDVFIFMTHNNILYNKKEISHENELEWLRISKLSKNQDNPFLDIEYQRYYAKGRLLLGLYSDAIVSCHTYIETLISLIYQEHLKTQEESKNQRKTFKKILFNEMSIALDKSWNTEGYKDIVSKWYNESYKLRCRIVHAGYAATYQEAKRSLQLTEELASNIYRLLQKNIDKYADLKEFITLNEKV